MTTTTRNEAADLLMEQIEAQIASAFPGYARRSLAMQERVREAMGSALDAALAAAKAEGAREAVERIRLRIAQTPSRRDSNYVFQVVRILDEEAAR